MRHLVFGGITPRTHSTKLEAHTATVAENVRFYRKAITPLESPRLTSEQIIRADGGVIRSGDVIKSIYRYGDVWFGFPAVTDSVKATSLWQDDDWFIYHENRKLYRQSPGRALQRIPPELLGICQPNHPPKLTMLGGAGCQVTPPAQPCPEKTASCSPMEPYAHPPEARAYVVTYRTARDNCKESWMESAPSPPSLVVDVLQDDAVILTAMDTDLPPNAAFRCWYRVVALSNGSAEFLYVGESPIDQPVFIDKLCPQELGEVLPTEHHYPPECVDGIAQMGNIVLAVWSGRDIWFSEPGLPHAYKPTSRQTVPYPIVAVVGYTPFVEGDTHFVGVILTEGKTYVIVGRSPAESYTGSEDFTIRELEGWYPAVNRRGVCVVEGEVFYVSVIGIIKVSGTHIESFLTDSFTGWEWMRVDPYNCILAYDRHELILFSDGMQLLIPYAKADKDQPFAVSTHTARANAVGTYRQRVFFRIGHSLFQWSDGLPMTARWRSRIDVYAGLWRPTAIKAVGDFPILGLGKRHLKAVRAFRDWRLEFIGMPVSAFIEQFPEYRSSYAVLEANIQVRVKLYKDGELWFNRPLFDDRIHYTPHQGRGINWEVEISTNIEINELHYQTSFTDMVTEGGFE